MHSAVSKSNIVICSIMNTSLFVGILVFMNILVIMEGLFAHGDGLFWPRQIVQHYHQEEGMPFICHGGMWGDFLIVSLIVAWTIARHCSEWVPQHVLVMGLIMTSFTVAAHLLWMHNPNPDCLAWKGSLTKAGKIHLVYMTSGMAMVGMFYFHSRITSGELYTVSVLLSIHAFIANHKVLDIVKPYWWHRNFVADFMNWISIAAYIVPIWWRTWYLTSHRLVQ